MDYQKPLSGTRTAGNLILRQVGCPGKLTDKLIAKAKECLYGGYESVGDVIPSVAGLACYLEIARSTAYEYGKQ
ncbi:MULTISPECIES: terminase small subunit [Xenorhabdus]|uniref:terminase small subunit n=1 Tax=Xenorhabdus TaxID=626 RepID=UPI000AAE6718